MLREPGDFGRNQVGYFLHAIEKPKVLVRCGAKDGALLYAGGGVGELTSHNVIDKDLQGEGQIKKEHIDNNLAVRKILQERGVRPENLPAVEDVKKVERRLNADNKKATEKPDAFKILPPPEE